MKNQLPIIGELCFPWGGAGNHLRWLLFLDKRIPNIYSKEDKLTFIKNKIYNEQRTWHNWLQFEWEYRPHLNYQIAVDHEHWDWEQDPLWDKKTILFLKFQDPKLPLQHYFHLNLGMNSTTPEEYIKSSMLWKDELLVISNSDRFQTNKLIIDADDIFDKTLSKKIYQSSIEFFNLSDNYEEACIVHDWYYQCRQHAAQDFYNYFTSSDFQQYLIFMKELING